MKKQEYNRIGMYCIDYVFELVGNKKIVLQDKTVNMTSDRYRTFKNKGIKCCTCGLEGKFFALERASNDKSSNLAAYHFNLYGHNINGNEVMLTKDHIIPKSKGGADTLKNYQIMCIKCNNKKGNTLDVPDIL